MTDHNIVFELARRSIPADITPQDKAIKFRAIEAAVKEAGSRAACSWLLVKDLDVPDVFAAFQEQVEAFSTTKPQMDGQPAQQRRRTIRRSSVLDGL